MCANACIEEFNIEYERINGKYHTTGSHREFEAMIEDGVVTTKFDERIRWSSILSDLTYGVTRRYIDGSYVRAGDASQDQFVL